MKASSCTNIPIEKLVRTWVAMGMDGWMDPFSTAGKSAWAQLEPCPFFHLVENNIDPIEVKRGQPKSFANRSGSGTY